MATIANLVVKVGADVAELRQRLDEAARRTEAWARKTGQSAATVAQAMRGHGTMAAAGFLQGLEQQFQRDTVEARELLFRGLIDRAEFQQRGAQAAADFNRGILSGIETFADARALTEELNAKLVGALKDSGLRAGQAFGQGVLTGAGSAQSALSRLATSTGALGQIVNDTTGRFTSLGRRAVPVVTNVAFGFESIVRGASAAESGARAALRSVANFAGVFGPQGLLVAGVAAAMSAAIEYFRRQRDEMKKTREAFEEHLAGMIRAGDQLGIQRQLQLLEVGDVAKGLSSAAPNAFVGGLRDLQARLAQAQANLQQLTSTARAASTGYAGAQLGYVQGVTDSPAVQQARAAVHELEAQVAELKKQRQRLVDVLMHPVTLPTAPTGLPTVTVTGKTATAQAAEAMKALGDAVERVVALQKVADDTQAGVPGLLEQQLALYDQITRALVAQTDPLSEQAQTLQKMLGTMRELESVRVFRLGVSPALGLAPRAGASSSAMTVAAPTGPISAAAAHIVSLGKLIADQVQRADLWGRALDATRARLDEFGASLRLRAIELAEQFTKPAETLRSAGQAVADTLLSVAERASPMALLFGMLDGFLQAVEPLLKAFLAPLTAVGQVLAMLIEPVLRLMFPVLRAVAVALAFFGEIVARVTGGVARALGNFIVAIGKLIGKVPGLGGLGRSIQRLGKSFLTFADEQAENAKKLAETRKELSKMKFGDTEEAISGLGQAAAETAEQLRNVPLGFKIALDRFLATTAIVGGGAGGGTAAALAPGIPAPARTSGAPIESFVINGGVHIDGAQKSGAELLEELTAAARDKARRMFGDSSRASEVFAYGQVFTTR